MNPVEIRRRALLAAAKVTLSLVALGCGAGDSPSVLGDRNASEIGASGAPACGVSDARCGTAVAGTGGSAAGSGQAGAGVAGSGVAGGGQAGSGQAGSGQAGSGGSGGSGQAGGEQAGSAAGSGEAGSGQGGTEAAGQGGSQAGGQAGFGLAGQAGQAGGVAQVCGGSTEPPYADEQVSCCVGVLKEAFPEDQAPPEHINSQVAGCCNLLASVTETTAVDTLPWSTMYSCCPFLKEPFSAPACSPWGPPTPPEMVLGLLDDGSWLEAVA